MNNKIYDAFDKIVAEASLKQSTYEYLENKVYRKKKASTLRNFAVAFASFLIIACAGFLFGTLYFTESAFIDIDVNPSMELTINRFSRVINARAYNDEGEQILNSVDIINKSERQALMMLIDEMAGQGYIDNAQLFTTTLQSTERLNESRLIASLKKYIEEALSNQDTSLQKDIFVVDEQTKADANRENITPAKYLAIVELQQVDPTATFESCHNCTISEIKMQTHGHKGGGHQQGNGQGSGTSTGHSSRDGHSQGHQNSGSGNNYYSEENSEQDWVAGADRKNRERAGHNQGGHGNRHR